MRAQYQSFSAVPTSVDKLKYYGQQFWVYSVSSFKSRYFGAVFGVLWSFLNPMLQVLVYFLIFTYVVDLNIENYLMFLLLGVFPWSLFASSINQSAGLITGHSNEVKKRPQAYVILPISNITINIATFLIANIGVYAYYLIAFENQITFPAFFMLCVALFGFYLFICGLSLLVAGVSTIFSDLKHLIPFVVQFLFFLTPVFYGRRLSSDVYEILLKLNPIAQYIQTARDVFAGAPVDKGLIVRLLVAGLLSMTIGWWSYSKLRSRALDLL